MKHLILVKFETNLKTYMKRSDICWKLQNFMISDELDLFSYRQISIKSIKKFTYHVCPY